MDLWHRLKLRWESEGFQVPPGVSSSQLDAVEAKYGVVLPPDVREYFSFMNGMTLDWVHDNAFLSFWPLERFQPLSDDRLERFDWEEERFGDYIGKGIDRIVRREEAKTLFQFGDHSIRLPTFVIRLGAMMGEQTPIFAVTRDAPGPCLRSREPTAKNLTDFFQRLLDDSSEWFW